MAQVKLLKLVNGIKQQHSTSGDDITAASLTSGAVLLKDSSGNLDLRNAADSAYVSIHGQDATFDGDVVIQGNVTVNGTTTSIDTTNLLVEDALITLAKNQTGMPSLDAGIEIERGDSANAEVLWNETTDRWQAGVNGSLLNIVLSSTTDTLTNKTIDAGSNTITNIGSSEVIADVITGQTALSAVDAAADYVLVYDASAGSLKKVLVTDLDAGEANTASNIGTGVGVFAQKNGTDLEFKSLVSANGSIVFTGNASEVDAVVDPSAINVGDFVDDGTYMDVATYDPANIAQQVVGLSATQTLTNKTINPESNTIDGDVLDITFNPANYSPDSSISEANDVDDLSAHLKGIDTALAGLNKISKAYTAGENLTAGDVVYISAANTVSKADASAISTGKAVGFAVSTVSAAASVNVLSAGSISISGASFTAGNYLFLSTTAGAVTETAPTSANEVVIKLGVASDSTTVDIDIDEPVVLS